VVRCGAVWCSVVQCGALWCIGAVRCDAVRCSAVQCSAVQCGAVRYSAVQCSAVRCSAVRMIAGYFYFVTLCSFCVACRIILLVSHGKMTDIFRIYNWFCLCDVRVVYDVF
jgi:hypothetical protein